MPNGIITKEQFEEITDTHVKLNILFVTMLETREDMRNHCGRIKKLEQRKMKDTSYAVGGGFLGGFVAMIARWISGN
jgi:hypothetical protein